MAYIAAMDIWHDGQLIASGEAVPELDQGVLDSLIESGAIELPDEVEADVELELTDVPDEEEADEELELDDDDDDA